MKAELSIKGAFENANAENLIRPSWPVRICLRMIAALKKLSRLIVDIFLICNYLIRENY